MRTKSYHCTAFGNMVPNRAKCDQDGYVTYHDSPRYAKAPRSRLEFWADHSPFDAVRNAAETELAERRLAEWRNSH